MKKTAIIICFLFVVLCIISACTVQEKHEHVYGEWKTEVQADCTHDGEEIRYCQCGETEKRTVKATGHSYEQKVTQSSCNTQGITEYVCSLCGDSYNEAGEPAYRHKLSDENVCEHCGVKATEGLKYDINAEGTAYILSGIGSATDKDIIIPACFNGKKVKGIATGAFSDIDFIESIFIGENIEYANRYAICNCSSLKNIYISSETLSVDGVLLYGCNSLQSVYYSGTIDDWSKFTGAINGEYNLVADYGHDYHTVLFEEATCVDDGKNVIKCNRCAVEKENILRASGHKISDGEVVEATCEKDGKVTGICDKCGQKTETTIVAKGHVVENYEVTIKATCSQDGEEHGICLECGEDVTRVIPSSGHGEIIFEADGGKCGNNATGVYKCQECGQILSEAGHIFTLSVIASTCSVEGRIVRKCVVCGKTEEESIPATGHVSGEWIDEIKADCTHTGTQKRYCLECGVETDFRETSIAEHNYLYSTDGDGNIVAECSVCGDFYSKRADTIHTVSFDTGGGENIPDMIVSDGESVVAPVPYRDGYDFAGWYIDEDRNNYYNNLPIVKDTVLYADWVESCVYGEYSQNLIEKGVSEDFEYKVESSVKLTDENVSDYITVKSLNDNDVRPVIISSDGDQYVIGTYGAVGGDSYTVQVSDGVVLSERDGNEFSFTVATEEKQNVKIADDVKQIKNEDIYSVYNTEKENVIILYNDLLNIGDKAVVLGDNGEMTSIIEIVGEEAQGAMRKYSYLFSDGNGFFTEYEVFVEKEISGSDIILENGVTEEITQAFMNSPLYFQFENAAETFALNRSEGEYYYGLNKIAVVPAFSAKGKSITFSIKATAEFARLHTVTHQVQSLVTFAMEVETQLSFGVGFSSSRFGTFSINLSARNQTSVNIYLYTGASSKSNEDLYYFKKEFLKLKDEGDRGAFDANGAGAQKDITLGRAGLNVCGFGLSLKIKNNFKFDMVGKLGAEAYFESGADFVLKCKSWNFDTDSSAYARTRVSAYMMGKVEVSDMLSVEVGISFLGIVGADLSFSAGPYVAFGGYCGITSSNFSSIDTASGGYFEVGVKLNAKIHAYAGILFWYKHWNRDLFNQKIVLASAGNKKLVIGFEKRNDECYTDADFEKVISCNDIVDRSALIQDLSSMSTKYEDVKCKYYLLEDIPYVTMDVDGNIVLEGCDSYDFEIPVKVVSGDIFKYVTVRIHVDHEHVMGEWEYLKKPTCIDEGKEIRTCKNCSYSEHRSVSATGHFFGEWTVSEEPTCTVDGIEVRKCTECKAFEERTLDAVGHRYINHICSACGDCDHEFIREDVSEKYLRTEANCLESATYFYSCPYCDGKTSEKWFSYGDPVGHIYSDNYTCHDRECVVCAHIELASTEHDFTDWLPVDISECTQIEYNVRMCKDCGYIETDHDGGVIHAHEFVNMPEEATCTQSGYEFRYVCVNCGYEPEGCKKILPPKGHNIIFSDLGETHRGECSECGYLLNETAHSFSEWDTVAEAGCITEGLLRRTCSVCGHVEVEILEAVGHKYVSSTVEATCTDAGYVYHECSVCKDNYISDNTPALGHDYAVVEGKEPTCTEKGYKDYHKCARCGDNDFAEIAALGHDYIIMTGKEPTCTESGYSDYSECTRCKDVQGRKELSATGHKYGEWEVVTSPSCTENGLEKRICGNCVNTETRVVYALGHDTERHEGKEPTCTESGYNDYVVCRRCDYTTYAEIPAIGHMYSLIEGLPATCTENGYTEYTECKNCGDKQGYQVLPAKGHSYGEWLQESEPSCEKEGVLKRVCDSCGEKEYSYISALGHDFEQIDGLPATCTDEGYSSYTKCKRCGKTEGFLILPPNGHEFEHYEGKEPDCTHEGYSDYDVCSVCGFSTYTSIPAKGHELTFYEKKEPTCTESGYEAYEECSVCGHTTRTDIPATGHDYEEIEGKEPTCTEKGHTGYSQCVNCGDKIGFSELEAKGHQFSDWVTVKENTCTEDGEEERSCTACNITENRTVKAKGHDFEEFEGKEATCTESGYQAYEICKTCGYSTYKEIAAKGHDYGAWTVTKTETCTEDGLKIRICSRCSDEQSEIIPKKGHDITHYEAKQPTCTDVGHNAYDICSECDYSTYEEIPELGHAYEAISELEPTCTEKGHSAYERCTRCADKKGFVEIDALGHSFGEWTELSSPDCTKSGKESRICASCGEKEERVIPALGHDIEKHTGKAPTCFESGWADYETCNRCEYSTYEKLPKLEHSYVKNVIAPTCTEKGYTVNTCKYCGDSYISDYVEALDHDYIEKAVSPTCTENGYTLYQCNNCEHSYKGDYVQSLGHLFAQDWTTDAQSHYLRCTREGCGEQSRYGAHVYGSWETVKEPTCSAVGQKERRCNVCGYCQSNVVSMLLHECEYTTETVKVEGGIDVTVYEICKNCDYRKEETSTFIHVHYKDPEIILPVAPTCTKDGSSVGLKCSECGEILDAPEVISALGHDFVNGECTRCGEMEESLYFALNSDGTSYEVTSVGSITDENIVIPSEYRGLPVVGIAEGAFENCSHIRSVYIPSSVVNIGNRAFYGCISLRYVNISDGVVGAGEYAFSECTSLTEVIIPGSLTSLGKGAFKNCRNIKGITLSAGITSIEEETFSGCSALTDVDMSQIVFIGNRAFAGCVSLKVVNINDNIQYIESEAFAECMGIVKLDIGTSLWYIGDNAFTSCVNLIEISVDSGNADYLAVENCLVEKQTGRLVLINSSGIIPADERITAVGSYVFGKFKRITEVTIPDNIEIIEANAFENCISLMRVTVGRGVTEIQPYAFSGCSKLLEVVNKSSLNIVKGASDNGYIAYYAVSVTDSDAQKLFVKDADGYVFYSDETGANYLVGYEGNKSDLTLPESFNGENYEIFRYAFAESDVESVILSEGVTSIGVQAFYNSKKLKHIHVSSGVKNIEPSAFRGCSELSSITVDEDNGIYAGVQNCIIDKNNKMLVVGCKNSVIPADGTVEIIGDSAFFACEGLESIIIPSGIKEIKASAFYGCTSLSNIVLGADLIKIGDSAFRNCTMLGSVELPASVNYIGKYAFDGDKELKSVVFINQNGWFFTPDSMADSGVSQNVSVASTNAEKLSSTHSGYYWKRV